jgi:lipopolysaccharide transport system permease protein
MTRAQSWAYDTLVLKLKTSIEIAFRQIRATVLANMKSRYRGSVAGFLWVVINPLFIYGAQSFVFHYILKIQTPNYFVFLLSGLLPWFFITQSLEMCTNIFVVSGRLLKSIPIHPLVCLLAQVFDNFINLVLLVALLFIPAVLFHAFPPWKFLLLPIPLLICLTAVIGMAWWLATIQIFFRDVRFVLSWVLNISFFLTPIFYGEQYVDESYRWIFRINIFRYLIMPFRDLISDPIDPKFFQDSALAFALSLALFGLAAMYWRGRKNVAYFYL